MIDNCFLLNLRKSFIIFLLPLLMMFIPDSSHAKKQDFVDSLIKSLPELNDSGRIEAFLQLAENLKQKDTERALEFGNKALQLAVQIEDKPFTGRAYSIIGDAWYFKDYNKAIEYYSMTLEIANSKTSPLVISKTLNNMGLAHRNLGNYDVSLKCFMKALKIPEVQKDNSRLSQFYSNIGGVYYYQDNNDLALEYFEKALAMEIETRDTIGMAGMYNNIGSIYFETARYQEALPNFEKALNYIEATGNDYAMARIINNIGRVYWKTSHYEKALEYYNLALSKSEGIGSSKNTASALHTIGMLYIDMKQYAKALQYLNRSLDVAAKAKLKPEIQDNYLMLSKAYSKMNDFGRAYEYYKLYTQLKDSIYNEQKSKQIAEMEAKYQNEKNEKEIAILTNENKVKELEMSKQKTQRNALIGGLLFILAVAFLLYNRFRVKQKANKLLREQKKKIEKQNTELEEHRKNLAEKNKNITDSINYAMRIQTSIMPTDAHFKKLLPDSFVFYKPKDIVSGDFYWVEKAPLNPPDGGKQNTPLPLGSKEGGLVLFAVVDCTGHGVPGALMSVVGMNLLNQAVLEKGVTRPADILRYLDGGIRSTLSQRGKYNTRDGMDLALCSINFNTLELQYAGAHNPIYYIRNGELIELKGDNLYIGVNCEEKNEAYTNHSIPLQKGDSIYLFSDGYADQFGGPKGKKFKYKSFRKLLLSIQEKPMQQQKETLNSALAEWQGDLEQVDDICVIGMRV